jgi:hypothetical protein
MMLETMNDVEIAAEILKDYRDYSQKSSTISRLCQEYDRERRKNRISKDARYPRCYEIKSSRKNTWIFFLIKDEEIPKYRGPEDTNIGLIVYYYNRKGLRAFSLQNENKFLVYNGHVFTRYRERMNLSVGKPLDNMKRFFNENPYGVSEHFERDGKNIVYSVYKDGIVIGELKPNGWRVMKTFLTRDLTRKDQNQIEDKLIQDLINDMKIAKVKNLDGVPSALILKNMGIKV